MRSRLFAFAADRKGNFGILASLLAVPLVFSVGLAIDYTTITSRKALLQNAIDAAVLAIARQGKEVSDEEAAAIAHGFLDGNFEPGSASFEFAKVGTRFIITAKTGAGLAFGGLFGYSNWPVQARATADIAYASYEIALVLDTTGSMKGGKLTALKDAVLGLVDNMSAQVVDKAKLKFAMVPFAAFVNVGPQYGPSFTKKGILLGNVMQQVAGSGAPWLDLNAVAPFPQSELGTGGSRFQLYQNLGLKWQGCVETRYAAGKDLDIDDTTPSAAKPETLFAPTFAIDEPDSGGYSNSYIRSDAKPHDASAAQKKKRWAKYGAASDAAGSPLDGGLLSAVTTLVLNLLGNVQTVAVDGATPSDISSNRKGPGVGCDVQAITPLTNDYKLPKTNVNALQAAGNTNIMEGVAWGNRVLSPGVPFTETNTTTKNLRKIMVVLTDGTNVFGNNGTGLGSSYSSQGYLVDGRLGIEGGGAATTTSLMNARTLKACDLAKANGIEVYTIRLEEPNVTTGSMLKECASAADHYFDVPSRTQLDEAFKAINDKIIQIRISS